MALPPKPYFFCAEAQNASGGHIFSLLREKIWKKRAPGYEIALMRGKAYRFCVPFIVGALVKERPSGGASNQAVWEYRSAVNI